MTEWSVLLTKDLRGGRFLDIRLVVCGGDVKSAAAEEPVVFVTLTAERDDRGLNVVHAPLGRFSQ